MARLVGADHTLGHPGALPEFDLRQAGTSAGLTQQTSYICEHRHIINMRIVDALYRSRGASYVTTGGPAVTWRAAGWGLDRPGSQWNEYRPSRPYTRRAAVARPRRP